MKFILDRIGTNGDNKRIATFECDGNYIDVFEDNMPSGFMDKLFVNAIVESEYTDGKMINPVILAEETDKKVNEMKNRLSSIFKKGKKQ